MTPAEDHHTARPLSVSFRHRIYTAGTCNTTRLPPPDSGHTRPPRPTTRQRHGLISEDEGPKRPVHGPRATVYCGPAADSCSLCALRARHLLAPHHPRISALITLASQPSTVIPHSPSPHGTTLPPPSSNKKYRYCTKSQSGSHSMLVASDTAARTITVPCATVQIKSSGRARRLLRVRAPHRKSQDR